MQSTFATGIRREYRITLRGSEAVLGARTWVMGVLNVTPDSFSDGGRYLDADAALGAPPSLPRVESGGTRGTSRHECIDKSER